MAEETRFQKAIQDLRVALEEDGKLSELEALAVIKQILDLVRASYLMRESQ